PVPQSAVVLQGSPNWHDVVSQPSGSSLSPKHCWHASGSQSTLQSALGVQDWQASRLSSEHASDDPRNTSAVSSPSSTAQHPKQSHPGGTYGVQASRHAWDCVSMPAHALLSRYPQPMSAPGSSGSQRKFHVQPSSPWPLLPSKKQSCLQSTLSPGIPVRNEASSSSHGPVHSGSNRSTRPSPSLSTPSPHA